MPETELYTKVIDFQNLFHAFRKAARGKRGHPEVATFARGRRTSF